MRSYLQGFGVSVILIAGWLRMFVVIFKTLLAPAVVLVAVCGCNRAVSAPPAQTASLASTRPDFHERLALAKDLFYRAVAGDRPALDQSRRILDEMGGRQSGDAQVLSYTGAAELLAAEHAILPWDKAGLANDGLNLEDRAVQIAPQDLEVRFLRGVTNYQLPGFVGRHQLAVSDLAEVAKVAQQAADSGQLDVRAAAADLDYYGKAMEETYQLPLALGAWQSATRLNPQGPGGIDAAKHLREHGVKFPATQETSGLSNSPSARSNSGQ